MIYKGCIMICSICGFNETDDPDGIFNSCKKPKQLSISFKYNLLAFLEIKND